MVYYVIHIRMVSLGIVICYSLHWALVITSSNAFIVTLPGETSGFISELLVFLGLYHLNPLVVFAALAIILTPCYALWLFHRVSYGFVPN